MGYMGVSVDGYHHVTMTAYSMLKHNLVHYYHISKIT